MRRLCILLLSLAATSAQAQQLPDGFAMEYLGAVDGRTVDIDLLPDGRIVTIHKDNGNVSVWRPGDAVAITFHTIPDISFIAERGLLALAIDPAWPVRPYLYVYLNHNSGEGRLVMLTVAGDLTDSASNSLSVSSSYLVLAGIPDFTFVHNGASLRFDSNGLLYLSLGDDSQMCPSQNLESMLGKILRLDVTQLPLAGPGPPARSLITPSGNPFNGPDEIEKLVYVWGLRNPFRFDIDLTDNRIMIGDVGSEEFEEINEVLATDVGPNFGWPLREGFDPDNPGQTCGLGNTFIDPVYAYPRGQGAAVIGGLVYRDPGGGFGSNYDGSYFFHDFLQQFVRRLVPGMNGWELAPPVPGQPNATDWATNIGRATSFRLGADGAIYFLNFQNAGVNPGTGLYRIVGSDPVAAPWPEPTNWTVSVAPNPAGTSFNFRIDRFSGDCQLRIYDAAGRHVRTVKQLPEGVGQWDGQADDGTPVASGVYYYRVTDARQRSRHGKLTVLR